MSNEKIKKLFLNKNFRHFFYPKIKTDAIVTPPFRHKKKPLYIRTNPLVGINKNMYSGSFEPKWALRGVLCALKKTLKQLVLGTNPSTYVYVCEWRMQWHTRNTLQYTFTIKSNICQQDVWLFYNSSKFCTFSSSFLRVFRRAPPHLSWRHGRGTGSGAGLRAWRHR